VELLPQPRQAQQRRQKCIRGEKNWLRLLKPNIPVCFGRFSLANLDRRLLTPSADPLCIAKVATLYLMAMHADYKCMMKGHVLALLLAPPIHLHYPPWRVPSTSYTIYNLAEGALYCTLDPPARPPPSLCDVTTVASTEHSPIACPPLGLWLTAACLSLLCSLWPVLPLVQHGL
jgi:hypothetical protein